jgi:uncharacterized protein YcaQ
MICCTPIVAFKKLFTGILRHLPVFLLINFITMISLSISQARHLALYSQGLLGHGHGKGKKGITGITEHLGYIQIDTLSVVARAHHHTLWSRLSDYDPNHLDELVKEKKVFEYWSHAASYLPMSEYRFTLPRKKLYLEGRSHWFKKDTKDMRYVLDRIKEEGPLRSKDFEAPGKGKGVWYEWKPAKQALEQLFMEGTLMVAYRQGFQKVYDLTERVLPAGVNTAPPTEKEYARYLITKAIEAHGIVMENEIAYLRKGWNTHVKNELAQMVSSGELVNISVEGSKDIYFTTPQKIGLLHNKAKKSEDAVHILSPFDNSLIQRKRIEKLFGFNFMIECYLPEAKRTYGYFCLPVLFNDRFAGRFDPKADRASKTFYVYKLFMEPGFEKSDMLPPFAEKLKEFAAFNGCDKIVIEKTEPKGMIKELKKLVK